jgi:hypothetical protein
MARLPRLTHRRHTPQQPEGEAAEPRRTRRHRSAAFRLEKLAELDRLQQRGTISAEQYQQWRTNLLR